MANPQEGEIPVHRMSEYLAALTEPARWIRHQATLCREVGPPVASGPDLELKTSVFDERRSLARPATER